MNFEIIANLFDEETIVMALARDSKCLTKMLKSNSSELLEVLKKHPIRSIRGKVYEYILESHVEDTDSNVYTEAILNVIEYEGISKLKMRAKNIYTPAEVLAKLAEDKEFVVRIEVAANPNTPTEVLAKFAEDKDYQIRESVATNPNTPTEVLAKLAENERYRECGYVGSYPIMVSTELIVERAVAANPNTPAEVLAKLAEDKEFVLRESVAANPNTPAEVLAKLAEDKKSVVRIEVAANPNTPVEVLTKLAVDDNRAIRKSAVKNSNFKNGK